MFLIGIIVAFISLANAQANSLSPLRAPKFALQVHAPGISFHKSYLTLFKTQGNSLVVDIGKNYNDSQTDSGSSKDISFAQSLGELTYATNGLGIYRLANRGRTSDSMWFFRQSGKRRIGTVDYNFKFTSGVKFDNQGFMSIGGNGTFSVCNNSGMRRYLNNIRGTRIFYLPIYIGKLNGNFEGHLCVPVQLKKA